MPADLAQRLGEHLARVALNRYPAPRPAELLAKIKRTMNVPAACDVLLGNGSDELISMMSMACSRPGAKVVAPVPGFVMYEMSARFAHLEFVGVPLKADFTLDADALIAAIDEHRPALVYLAYPNNPTGTLYDDADMERVIAAAKQSLVVIDEAYQPFAEKSWMPRAADFDNIVVMRTVSKLGLAGIRLGYMAGRPGWILQVRQGAPAVQHQRADAGNRRFLLDHLDVLDAQAADLRAQRAALASEVAALPGMTVFPSAGNFLLVRVPDAAVAFETNPSDFAGFDQT